MSNLIKEFQQLIDKANADREKGWQFKVGNYRKVLNILKGHEKELSLEEYIALLRKGGMKIPNPKSSKIVQKIKKILEEGTLGLKVDDSVEVIRELSRIPEIGPSKAKKLYDEGIRGIADLLKDDSSLNDKQKIGLRYYQDLEKRIPRKEMDIWNEILRKLIIDELETDLLSVELAGSYRRNLPDSGDIDCYVGVRTVKSDMMNKLITRLSTDSYLSEDDIWSRGSKKMMGVVKFPGDGNIHRHLDIWIYPENEYPFAILYATGSGEFNINMRNYAREIGYSLSDKSIRYGSNKGEIVSNEDIYERLGKGMIETEEDIFEFLGLPWYEPSERLADVDFKQYI